MSIAAFIRRIAGVRRPGARPVRARRFERSRRWARRVGDLVPPTGRGWCVAGLSGVALWFWGIGALDLVLYVVGLAGLVLVTASALLVGITAIVLSRRPRPAPLGERTLEAGSTIRTGFELPALGAVPLVQLRWEWLEPAEVEVRPRLLGRRLVEEVVASRRCQAAAIVRRISVTDAFGLSRVAWRVSEATPVTILPSVGRLRNMPVVQSLAGGEGLPHPGGVPEGDRMDIRRYVPGDSVRNILWKQYARTRQLNVRTPERAIARARKTVAYLVVGPGDEPAAAAARVAVEAGLLGRKWFFGADGAPEPTASVDRALAAIARSGSMDRLGPQAGGAGLAAFLECVSADGPVHCVVFAPARAGSWLGTVLGAARRHPGTLAYVLGTDGVIRRTARPLWRRLLLDEQTPVGTPAQELSLVLRQITAVGAEALVVDRLSGRPYTHSHQKALGALQA